MSANYNAAPLLEVEGLRQYFPVSSTYTVKAVENVSFKVYPGETYGLVGESGSGKSTIGRSIIRLYDPTEGKINFCGMDISGKMNRHTKESLRVQMQMIFQDPMASLNPRKKIKDIIGEALDIHHVGRSDPSKGRPCQRTCRPLPSSVFWWSETKSWNCKSTYLKSKACNCG